MTTVEPPPPPWSRAEGRRRSTGHASLRFSPWRLRPRLGQFDREVRRVEQSEIAENLHRAELTALEYDEHVAEWVRLTEGVDGATCVGQVDASGRQKSPQQMPPGINAAVRELGIERTRAQRAVKVAFLSEEAKPKSSSRIVVFRTLMRS